MEPKRIFLMAGLIAALSACGGATPGDADGNEGADEAADSSEHTEFEGALLLTAVDGAAVSGGAAAQAMASAAHATTVYLPAGCARTVVTGGVATYLFTDCTGPRGLLHLLGTMRITYGTTAGTLTGHAESLGLRTNGAVLNLNADLVYSTTDTGFSLAVDSRSGGIGPRGIGLTRSGTYTADWDNGAACRTVTGTWETAVGARQSETVATDLRRCGVHCPQPGGEVTYSRDAQGASLTLMFPGGDNALWATSNHETGTVALTCTD